MELKEGQRIVVKTVWSNWTYAENPLSLVTVEVDGVSMTAEVAKRLGMQVIRKSGYSGIAVDGGGMDAADDIGTTLVRVFKLPVGSYEKARRA